MLKDTNFLINSLKNIQYKITIENYFYLFFEDITMIFMFDFCDITDFIDYVEIPS
jgi:hypothetical protein